MEINAEKTKLMTNNINSIHKEIKASGQKLQRIKAVEMRCYRRLVPISYKDHITDEIVCKKIQALNSPLISLNLQKLSFVPKFKYLGSFITQDNSDDENMRRQRGNCYARSNGIIKNFYACSPVVKCDLFKAFCCNMYCSHLWCDFKNETLRRLIVGYNHSFRIIMKYPRYCSASGIFVFNNVPSFKELWRKSIYGFKQRVDNSLNKVVNTVANTTLLSSRLRKNWRTVLYRLPAA